MTTLVYIVTFIIIAEIGLRIYQKRISPQYYLSVYFGVPGVGKTTMAAYLAKKDLKKKLPVWSNVPIKGALQLDTAKDIGIHMLENGRVLIDEAGLEYDNREYKKFPKTAVQFFKLHRHYRLNIDVFSQSYDDFDKKIRSLAQRLYIVIPSAILPFFVKITRIRKRIGINEITKDIVDEYHLSRFEFKLVFCPPLWKLFSSFERPELPAKDWESWS